MQVPWPFQCRDCFRPNTRTQRFLKTIFPIITSLICMCNAFGHKSPFAIIVHCVGIIPILAQGQFYRDTFSCTRTYHLHTGNDLRRLLIALVVQVIRIGIIVTVIHYDSFWVISPLMNQWSATLTTALLTITLGWSLVWSTKARGQLPY